MREFENFLLLRSKKILPIEREEKATQL